MGVLDGKSVVITGGSLGIGLEIAKSCAHEGATIIIAARNKEDLQKAISEIKNISKLNHQSYQIDVSQYDKVSEFAGWISNNYKNIDGLVNCAGIYGPIGKISQIDINEFTRAIQINFLGTVNMCHAFYSLFNSSRKKIINYSGGGAASPFPYYSAYATSKSAIVRFTENLALELKDEDFDINCVAPGFVITRLHEQTMQAGTEKAADFYEKTKKEIEKGGVPAKKAADLTVFLLSSQSDGITGKFLSAPWDSWQDRSFQELLKTDKDLATLRRIDNKYFFRKEYVNK